MSSSGVVTAVRDEDGHIRTSDGKLIALVTQGAKTIRWWLDASSHVVFRRQYQAALDLIERERALNQVSCPDGGTHVIGTPTPGTPRCVQCGVTASTLLAQHG